MCVCQWDMGQMVGYLYPDYCQENLHLFGNKRASSLKKKMNISLITLATTVSCSLCLAFHIASLTMWLVIPYSIIMPQYRL